MTISQLFGWTPTKIWFSQNQPVLEWCHLGCASFTEPFFDQTVERCFRERPDILRQRTSIEALEKLQAISPGLAPTGFIFHLSRCGSTLISQMLAALPQNLMIAEAGPINAILSTQFFNSSITDVQRLSWLRGIVSALGQQQRGQQQHYLIKFTSWNVLNLPLIQKAFPNVPWIFVYRDPVEVMVSLFKNPPGWMENLTNLQFVAGFLGLDTGEVSLMSAEEYCARVLARFCGSALQHQDTNTLMLNYRQLPDAVCSRVLDFFQVAYSPDDLNCMQRVLLYDAKNPSKQFTGDSMGKQQVASALIRQMVKQWVGDLYEQLEVISLSQRMAS